MLVQPHFDLGPETTQNRRTFAGSEPWPDVRGEQMCRIVRADRIRGQARQQEAFGTGWRKRETRALEHAREPGGEFAGFALRKGEPARCVHPHMIERGDERNRRRKPGPLRRDPDGRCRHLRGRPLRERLNAETLRKPGAPVARREA